jgi:hypothetical protein
MKAKRCEHCGNFIEHNIDPKIKFEALRLFAEGQSSMNICRALDNKISTNTVYRVVRTAIADYIKIIDSNLSEKNNETN